MPRALINGTEIHFEDTGGDRPALLLIAGLGATGHIWGPLPRRLRSQFRIISYDHRWLGRSRRVEPLPPVEFGELVADARGILDHLGIARANVLGKSLGGMIALNWARQHPEDFQRMVIINASDRQSGWLWHRLHPRTLIHSLRIALARNPRRAEDLILKMTANLIAGSRYQQILDERETIAHKRPISVSTTVRQLIAAMRFKGPCSLSIPSLILTSNAPNEKGCRL